MGKQVTSALVMLLVEDGKIALTDSIAKYFPEAPAEFHPITVRHLLTHTSGIPDYTPGTLDNRRDYTEDELAKIAFGLKLQISSRCAMELQQYGLCVAGHPDPSGIRPVLR